MIILQLFWEFFKIGCFAFGGGYAVLSLLSHAVGVLGGLAPSEFADIVALSQVTPGPIAINAATYIGYRLGGAAGALSASLGVAAPSFILVAAAMRFLRAFKESYLIKDVFGGLRPATLGMIAAAAVTIGYGEINTGGGWSDVRGLALFITAMLAGLNDRISPIIILAAATIFGIFIFR